MAYLNIKTSELELNNGQVEGLPRNPRFIKDDRFSALVKSIEDAPEMLAYRSLLVFPHNGKYVVICGKPSAASKRNPQKGQSKKSYNYDYSNVPF